MIHSLVRIVGILVVSGNLAAAGAAVGATPSALSSETPSFATPPQMPSISTALPAVRQAAVFPTRRVPAPAAPIPGLPSRVQKVVDFYGGSTSARTLAQIPSRPTTGAQTRSSRPALPRQAQKPFQGAGTSPTLSPYLNLFREENNDFLPNYYAYVRPQRRQQNIARRQLTEVSRLRQQVQTVSFGSAAGASASRPAPSTGHGTRYLNTGGYYPAVRVTR